MSKSKTLEEIWEKLQQESKAKKDAENSKEMAIFELKEKQRQEYLERNRMYETLNAQSAAAAAGSGGGSIIFENYISQTDTMWLYPQVDIDTHLATYLFSNDTYLFGASPSYTFTRSGNVYSFSSLSGLVNFYEGVYNVTAVSQPIGNVGYSCGVGTRTRARKKDRLILKLNSGEKVVEWSLMTQLTNQNDLPAGGNSPQGTVGWSNIFCDWDLDGIQDPTSAAALALSTFIDGLVFKRI